MSGCCESGWHTESIGGALQFPIKQVEKPPSSPDLRIQGVDNHNNWRSPSWQVFHPSVPHSHNVPSRGGALPAMAQSHACDIFARWERGLEEGPGPSERQRFVLLCYKTQLYKKQWHNRRRDNWNTKKRQWSLEQSPACVKMLFTLWTHTHLQHTHKGSRDNSSCKNKTVLSSGQFFSWCKHSVIFINDLQAQKNAASPCTLRAQNMTKHTSASRYDFYPSITWYYHRPCARQHASGRWIIRNMGRKRGRSSAEQSEVAEASARSDISVDINQEREPFSDHKSASCAKLNHFLLAVTANRFI